MGHPPENQRTVPRARRAARISTPMAGARLPTGAPDLSDPSPGYCPKAGWEARKTRGFGPGAENYM